MTYEPGDILRFLTPEGRDLIGKLVLRGDIWGLVRVEKPTPLNILLDLTKVIGKVTSI